MIRFARVLPVAALIPLALAGCAATAPAATPSAGTVTVVATTNVWGDIVQTIGGDRVAVTSIISDPEQDPHEYQADAHTQLAISRAQLLVENGGGYDDFADQMVAASNAAPEVVNAVQLSTHANDAEVNEHVWYDYPTVQTVAQAIASDLSALDPAGASQYSANVATFVTGLQALEAREQSIAAAHSGEPVTITEPVPVYLLDACGLDVVTPAAFSKAIEDDTDASPAVLKQTLDLYTASPKPVALAENAQTSGAQSDAVIAAAKAAGVPVIPVTETLPDGMHYLDWQASILTQLEAAVNG